MSVTHTASPTTSTAGRDEYVDFLRGVVIVDMMLVHFSPYFASGLTRAINLTDVAMEGFLLVSGFMTGRHYLSAFRQRPSRVTKALVTRAIKLSMVQYILILAFSYPAFLFLRTSTTTPSVTSFLIDSFLFRNQVGLLHILPLFIAFSILSPMLLFFVARRWDALLVAASLVTFWLGYTRPDLFRYGSPALFPIAQWQIYFVAGLLLGARAHRRGHGMMANRPTAVFAALVCLALVVVLRYGAHLSTSAGEYLPDIARFPLSPGGALLGLAMVALAVSASSLVWPAIAHTWFAGEVRLFGRSSLLVFAIHVGFGKLIEVLVRGFDASVLIAYALIAANLVCCHVVLAWTEAARPADAPWAARSLKYLFG